MQTPRLIPSLALAHFPEGKSVHLAVGMFDGVHVGHQAVVNDAKKAAQADGGLTVVLTFTPHPSRILRPEKPTLLIMDGAQKIQLLFAAGADAVIEQPFDATIAELDAVSFVPFLKASMPGLKSIHVGRNFRFGKGRNGTPETLAETGRQYGIAAAISAPVMADGEPVSSTRIRGLLLQGRIEEANCLLGRPYGGCAPVVPGRQLGRTLGIPTLNLHWERECRPRYGVYAVRVRAHGTDAPARDGVANYGTRPTIDKNEQVPLFEVHLLDAGCPWTTGDVLCVEWLTFLRSEMKFPLLAALQAQMQQDKREAVSFFQASPLAQ